MKFLWRKINTEKKCGKKLGNVWNDGPKPNGNRHCVTRNNIILKKLEIKK